MTAEVAGKTARLTQIGLHPYLHPALATPLTTPTDPPQPRLHPSLRFKFIHQFLRLCPTHLKESSTLRPLKTHLTECPSPDHLQNLKVIPLQSDLLKPCCNGIHWMGVEGGRDKGHQNTRGKGGILSLLFPLPLRFISGFCFQNLCDVWGPRTDCFHRTVGPKGRQREGSPNPCDVRVLSQVP